MGLDLKGVTWTPFSFYHEAGRRLFLTALAHEENPTISTRRPGTPWPGLCLALERPRTRGLNAIGLPSSFTCFSGSFAPHQLCAPGRSTFPTWQKTRGQQLLDFLAPCKKTDHFLWFHLKTESLRKDLFEAVQVSPTWRVSRQFSSLCGGHKSGGQRGKTLGRRKMKFKASNIKMPATFFPYVSFVCLWFECEGTIPVVVVLFQDELQPLGHGTYQGR